MPTLPPVAPVAVSTSTPHTTRKVRSHSHDLAVRLALIWAIVVSILTTLLLGTTPATAAPVGVPPSGTGGTITAWGNNTYGQTTLPSSLDGKTVTAIAAGDSHSLALTADGTITAWGDNYVGQTTVPGSLDGKTVTAIAAGGLHSLVLTADGTITAWGYNGQGQTGVPASLDGKTVTAIAAGGYHSLALTADGTITAWGNNEDGQTTIPASLDGKTVTAIAAGGYHSLALTADGTITAWGNNEDGQTTIPASLDGKTLTAIAAGWYHSLALTTDGTITAWGNNNWGQTGVPASLDGKTVTAIAAGAYHSLALTADGTTTAWGYNSYGQATVPGTLDGKTVTAIAASSNHNLAIVAPATPAAPTITGIAPATGPRAGGTTVEITGTDFTDTTQVNFGSTGPATSYTIDSPTQITATSPAAGAVGRRHIRVTTPAGTSPTVPADVFKYTGTKPAVTGVAPATGPRAGGTEVVITGTDFTDATQVTFGSAGPATSYTVDSPTQITAVSPTAGTGGRRHIRITTPAGTSPAVPEDIYTYTYN